jgi:hypothetical protein
VIIFGLDMRVMFEIVTNLGDLIESAQTFEHLTDSSEILEGDLVTFRDVDRRHDPDDFGFARWSYQCDRFPAIQCIWPDPQYH